MEKNIENFFKPRYFLLTKVDQQFYLKWETVEGIIFDEARKNPEHITYLMAQDIGIFMGGITKYQLFQKKNIETL
ncbi:hypothetical protein [Bacillus solimangrovi]|uniref:Uncharacterized protein n=1 Tax=Bacillus solimangrovi TaxID=1305675 RepID=A0A1E5LJ72_9BACI|nr:hypothetical protein [Bacillus solimangrovi]OEH94111.1 hypothetical protein BFG57_09700 [Bacillus solimangrovi]